MRPFRKILVLVIASMPIACTAADAHPSCSIELEPESTVPPELPHRLHNEFAGETIVSFLVTPTGEVVSPTILSEEWRPIGRSKGQPVGYSEAILSAVAQWRYPRQSGTCRHQVPIKITFPATGSVSRGQA